jgi:hypothetical protein
LRPGTDFFSAAEGHEFSIVSVGDSQRATVLDCKFATKRPPLWQTAPAGSPLDLVPTYGATLRSVVRVVVQRYGAILAPATQRQVRLLVDGMDARLAETLLARRQRDR